MTHAVGSHVFLTDDDSVHVSHERAVRMVDEIIDSLRRHVHGAAPEQLEDAARNLAQMYGVLGMRHGVPTEVDPDDVTAPTDIEGQP